MARENLKRWSRKRESIDARHRGGTARSSEEASVMEVERRGWVTLLFTARQPEMGGTDWRKRSRTRFRRSFCGERISWSRATVGRQGSTGKRSKASRSV